MFSIRELKLVKVINTALSRFSGKNEPVAQAEIPVPSGNPWQQNLQRLAEERHSSFEHIEQREELESFVNNLTQAAYEAQQAQQKELQAELDAEQQQAAAQAQPVAAKRAGDRTVQNMKSWWEQSLVAADEDSQVHLDQLPGKPRLLKRWFE